MRRSWFVLWRCGAVHSHCGGSFLGNVHILFTTAFFLPCPTGLRLETAVKIDKKKTELYFSSREKNFLTEKEKRACHPEQQKHTLMVRSEV
jgi:hypothetical protein